LGRASRSDATGSASSRAPSQKGGECSYRFGGRLCTISVYRCGYKSAWKLRANLWKTAKGTARGWGRRRVQGSGFRKMRVSSKRTSLLVENVRVFPKGTGFCEGDRLFGGVPISWQVVLRRITVLNSPPIFAQWVARFCKGRRAPSTNLRLVPASRLTRPRSWSDVV
jgi:hypothetical protein